jgi:hypothetical protein
VFDLQAPAVLLEGPRFSFCAFVLTCASDVTIAAFAILALTAWIITVRAFISVVLSLFCEIREQ